MKEFYLIGTVPNLNGKILSSLIVQELHSSGGAHYPAHQLFLLIDGQWWRTFIDGPHLYWQTWNIAPVAWEIPEEGLRYPIRNLGNEFGLNGLAISHWSFSHHDDSPCLVLGFQDGHQVVCSGDSTAWQLVELTRWHFSDPRDLSIT